MKTTYTYDHYYTYEELQSTLIRLSNTYCNYMILDENLTTKDNRIQYAVTLTNQATGDANTKPALYIDGNIHAGEVTSSMVALHFIDYLLTNATTDTTCQYILDNYTVYVIPRIAVDGAEVYLSTPAKLRSTNVNYKVEEGGWNERDLDGDGVIRMMKVKRETGAYKEVNGQLIKREPSDYQGDFYDIFLEGDPDDSLNPYQQKPKWGLDFNRNFPFGWYGDHRQSGAGEYPLSNPECKAVANFILNHPNICCASLGHTSGGLLLYPPGTKPSASSNQNDMTHFKTIAAMGEKYLGYKPLHIFDSFMSDQVNYDSGALDDWLYQEQGIIAYTMEYWDVFTKAGKPIQWDVRGKEDNQTTLERYYAVEQWVKDNAPQYYKPWTPIAHPTLKDVEIGGIQTKFTVQNPPESLLCNELENATKFHLAYALSLPKLTVTNQTVTPIADNLFEVSIIVTNKGYLDTNITSLANEIKKAKPLTATISAYDAIYSPITQETDNLEGFGATKTSADYGLIQTSSTAKSSVTFKWIVKATKPLTITVSHPKAGTIQTTI